MKSSSAFMTISFIFMAACSRDSQGSISDDTAAVDSHSHKGADADGETVVDVGTGGETDSAADQCPGDPDKTEPGECGCGVPEGSCGLEEVLPTDTVLVRPESAGPIIAPITAYTWRTSLIWPDPNYELPLYKTEILDRETDAYWNYLVDELLLARVDVVMLHSRGCWDLESGYDGAGSLCPRWLTRFVDAVDRASAREVIKIGMFDPMGHYPGDVQHFEGLDKLDLSNQEHWKYFWDHNIKIFFDILPEDMWFLMDGKPVISTWHLGDNLFVNQEGNASKLLDWLKAKFKERYGLEPVFVLQDRWFQEDSTITAKQAVGQHGWFSPAQGTLHSYIDYNGKTWGVVGPGYRKIQGGVDNGGNSLPGCGEACREVLRRDGQTAIEGFEAGKNADFILLEGWTNISENNGFYRSNDWRYPAHYINIVRHYADPEPETLRFQAEGADEFQDSTQENKGGAYADRSLDVGDLGDKTGWYVGWTEPGEWLTYRDVELGCGTYRFTARVATQVTGKKMRLDLPGLETVTVPDTGGFDRYQLVHLGEVQLDQGTYNLRVLFETGGVNLDWFFLKRVNKTCH